MKQLKKEVHFATFFAEAPVQNSARRLITGSVCGGRVENLPDPLMRDIRYLDKSIDELMKWTPLDKILRTETPAESGAA